MSTIKAILFDFGGTLDNDGADWFSRMHAIIARHGCLIDRDQFQACADQAAEIITTQPDVTTLTMQDTAYRLCKHAREQLAQISGDGLTQWDPSAVAAEFARDSQTYFQRNRPILRELAQGFRLGCISNNWGNTVGWCRDAQFDPFFETIIDSTVVGGSKPDELIFQTALHELKLPARDCVYVGDKFEADIVGAAGAGLTAIWITGKSKKSCPDSSLVDHRIGSLDELLTLDFSSRP